MKTANISYDALGRTTATIEAYVDGVPSDDDDRITRYTYDGNDNVTSLTADLPAGQNDQTTVYTYGVTTAGGSNINHNGLLAGVTYPSDGNPATSETETFTYNALGQTTSKTDRNGTVHSYGYDPLGRLVSDTVTTLGAGVDGAIRRLGYTYNSQGRPEKVTSYANTAGTNVVNQVQRQYNGFGQLVSEYQAHDGAVNTGSTPKVQYTYAAEDKGARPTGMVYPDGRVLSYGYGTVGSLNDRISRLSALVDNDGTTMLEARLNGT